MSTPSETAKAWDKAAKEGTLFQAQATEKTGYVPGDKLGNIMRGTPNPEAIKNLDIAMRGTPAGIVSAKGAFSAAGKFFSDKFIQGIVLASIVGTASKIFEEKFNQVIPTNDLRIASLRALYTDAPDEETSQKARAVLEESLGESGYKPDQKALYLQDADNERQLFVTNLKAAQGMREQVPGESAKQFAASGLQGTLKSQEEQKKAAQEAEQAQLLGPFPDINIKNAPGDLIENATRLIQEVQRNPDVSPAAKIIAKQMQESLLRMPGEPITTQPKRATPKPTAAEEDAKASLVDRGSVPASLMTRDQLQSMLGMSLTESAWKQYLRTGRTPGR